jgi:outer membrane immunogenic protein
MCKFSDKITPAGPRENDWLRLTGDDQRQVQGVLWSVAMRGILVAAVIFGTVSAARAADLPDLPVLRGGFAPPVRNWAGWYVGGQVDFSSANVDLGHASAGLTNFMLRNSVIQGPVSQLTLFGKEHAQSAGFGAFVGRNWQWDDIVYGVEANYIYLNHLGASAVNSMGRRLDNPGGQTLPAGHTDRFDVSLSGAASLRIKDVTSLRGRLGWATGDFLPYLFGGLAVGRLAVSRSATVSSQETDVFDGVDILGNPIHTETPLSFLSLSQTEARGNNYTLGYVGGLGTEVMLCGNLFARAEWEYIRFSTVKNMTSNMNSGRLGVGYKF